LKPRTFSTPDRFLQLVFDFLAPLGQTKSTPASSPGVVAHEREPEGDGDLHEQHSRAFGSDQAHFDPFSHPQATHRVSLKGVVIGYCVVRSRRKTIALLISPLGLEVRAPRWVNLSQIKAAIEEREAWIFKQFEFMAQKRQEAKRSEIEIKAGCVSGVLGHQVQWAFVQRSAITAGDVGVSEHETALGESRETSESQEGHESLHRLKQLNAKRLKAPMAHIEIQCLQGGVWRAVSFEDWVVLLMTQAPLAEPSYRILLPIGDLFKKLEAVQEEEPALLEAQPRGPEGLGAHKRCAKLWMDTLHLHVMDVVARQRVAHFAALLEVTPTALSFGHAKHRWGSAGSNGAIRLNGHLVHVPLPLLDYVVAHELSHLKHMNHSAAFWALVARVMPDFDLRREQLKKVVMPQWV